MKKTLTLFVLAAVLLCACTKPNTMCRYGIHEDWEETITPALIAHVGQQAHQDYVSSRIAAEQCADIYGFLREFDIPYETFSELSEGRAVYDLKELTSSVYPWVKDNIDTINFFATLTSDRKQELTDAVKQVVDAYKSGTVPEGDDYPPYPDGFPSVQSLPDMTQSKDYTLYLVKHEGVGARGYRKGGIYVVVWADKTHQLVLTVDNVTGDDGKQSIVFTNPEFRSGELVIGVDKAVTPSGDESEG